MDSVQTDLLGTDRKLVILAVEYQHQQRRAGYVKHLHSSDHRPVHITVQRGQAAVIRLQLQVQ